MYVFGVYMCACLGYVYVCLLRDVCGVEYAFVWSMCILSVCVCVCTQACAFLFGVAVFGRMRLMASL